MNKEEILRKAQKEDDEMVVQIKNNSMKYTYIVLVLSAAVFAFIQDGQSVMDLCATVCYSVFAGHIYCFLKTKERFYLIMSIITIIVAIIATIRFFMGL